MAFLEWKDSYNIGVKEIDNQHRGLFDIISRLSTTNQYDPQGKYFLAMLNQLQDYSEKHFATEERYMQEANYPKLDEHRQEHVQFLTDLSALAQELKKKETDTYQKILGFLKDWYKDHILGSDRDYLEAFRAKGFK